MSPAHMTGLPHCNCILKAIKYWKFQRPGNEAMYVVGNKGGMIVFMCTCAYICMRMNHIFLQKAGLDVIQSHPLHKIHFGKYKTPSAIYTLTLWLGLMQ